MIEILLSRLPRLLMAAAPAALVLLLGGWSAGRANEAGWMALVEWAMVLDAEEDCPPEAATAMRAAREHAAERARSRAALSSCGLAPGELLQRRGGGGGGRPRGPAALRVRERRRRV